MREIKNNTRVRHFKGKEYIYLCKAIHSETGEIFAVYQADYGEKEVYIRPYDMFISEVDKAKYPDCVQQYRFEII